MEDWSFYRKKQKIAKKWAMILNNLSHLDTSLRDQSSANSRMYCEQVKIATQIASYVAARQFAIVLHLNMNTAFFFIFKVSSSFKNQLLQINF
jgi:hypothetical protein